jgi:hypothetical protein
MFARSPARRRAGGSLSEPKDRDDKSNRAGRVKHDAGGRAIWEWAVDTGRHALDSTSRLLQRLDLPGLSLLDEEQEKKKKAEAEEKAARHAGGNPYDKEVPTFGGTREADSAAGSRQSFNPYDNRAMPKRGAVHKPSAKPRITQPDRAAKKRGWLARLFGRGR